MDSDRHYKSSSNLLDYSESTISSKRIYKPTWRKLLWLRQDYPDNYVDSSFLSQLRRNTTVAKYSYWRLAGDFSLINLHLCNTCVVFVLFFGLYNCNWAPYIPTCLCSLVTVIGYFIWDSTLKDRTALGQLATLKSALLIVFTILILSPVLRSLTISTSSDSIWALSTWLTIFNVICNNYEYDIIKNKKFKSSVLSTNLIFANVIVLSSRLNSNLEVFCFILVAIQVHGLFPVFQFRIRKRCTTSTCSLLGLLYFVLVTLLVYAVIENYIIIVIWSSVNFFIVIFCPGYFIFLQQYKNELQGPWDPAKPSI